MLLQSHNIRPFCPIRDLVEAILPSGTNPKVAVVLRAYFDASYTEPDRPLVVVCACVAEVSRWQAFESIWQVFLSIEGLPFFHMTDFEAYKGDYKTWTQDQHREVMNLVTGMIGRHVELPISRAVGTHDFQWAASQNPHLAHYNPFTFCAIQCMQGIKAWADKKNLEGPVAYIFESGDRQDEHLIALRNYIQESTDRMKYFRWSGLEIQPKIESDNPPPYPLIPLQAADVWAFEVRKEMENYHVPGTAMRDMRKSVLKLIEKGIGVPDCGFYRREDLLGIEAEEW